MNLFLLLSNISILLMLLLLTRLKAGAQLSTVGISGKKVSKAVQREIAKPEQGTIRLLPEDTSLYNKGEKESTPNVPSPIHKPLLYPPLVQIKVTSNWGRRYHPISGLPHLHNGVDLKAYYEPVMAVAAGRVKKVGFNEQSGLFVTLDHGQGITSLYAHLKFSIIKTGQVIKAGQLIGISGNSGRSTAPHLHFSLKMDNLFVDPTTIISIMSPNKYN